MNIRKGKFVVFEGGEGSGKDTVIAAIREKYADRNDLVFTREPGGTLAGENIRAFLMARKSQGMDAKAELFLFLAARAQLLAEVIIPALCTGKVVVCNRFSLSTIAYQGYGRELRAFLPFLYEAQTFLVGQWDPDITIFLDVSPRVGLARVCGRGEEMTRFDEEDTAFHERVRTGFLVEGRKKADSFVIINADEPLELVQQQVFSVFNKYYK